MYSTTTRKKVIVFFTGALFLSLQSFGQVGSNVGINTTTPEAALDINGDIIIRTAEITAADGITLALDINTIRFSNYRVTGPTADFILAGITAGIDGRLVTLFNRSGFTMQLNNEDATAAATDMIVTGTNADITIVNKGIVNLQYDGAEQKWIVKSSSKGGSAITGGYWDTDGINIYNNNTGNIGIGTNNPAYKLTIQTPINSTGWMHIGGNDSIIVGEGIGGISAAIGTMTNHAFRLNTNSTGRLHIYPAGEVVVGSNTSGSFGKFTVETPNNSYGISHISTGGNILATNIGGTSAGIGTFSNTNMRIFSNSVSSIFVAAATNNVGIGTDNPTYKFTVETPNNSFGMAHVSTGGNILATNIGGTSAGIGTFSNTNMRVFCNGTSRIFIASATGNVGIGTDNPTYKLSVLGNIRSTEVVVETGWADYVFDKNYHLKSLDEVEKFIDQNKHLPGIPSAAEIKKNGLQLGETQKKMMEKIEELTLYIIELKKEITEIKKMSYENK
jgi:hypothetical protein